MNIKEIIIQQSKFQLLVGDITNQETDAVVNAANSRLAPGGGVAGAIHTAAGPNLWEECRKLGGCKTGEAKITGGHNLPNKFIIHTVGPVYSGSKMDQALLSACYLNSLRLADEHKIKSIAFPALSTGIFGYPIDKAAHVAISSIKDYLKGVTDIEVVRMVLYDESSYKIHVEVLDVMRAEWSKS